MATRYLGVRDDRPMRVVSWNCQQKRIDSPLWDVLTDLDADVLLLQEVVSLPTPVSDHYAVVRGKATKKDGTEQRFSTMLLVRGQVERVREWKHPTAWVASELTRYWGQMPCADVRLDSGERLTAVSVYSPAWPVDPARMASVQTAGVRLAQNPDVWVGDLLRAGLGSLRVNDSSSWLIGGDFNLSETFDSWPGGPRGNREYLDHMKELGLTECLRQAQGKLVPTYQNKGAGKPALHQIDHLFVTTPLADRLTSCDVLPEASVFGRGLSDHLPIVADFE